MRNVHFVHPNFSWTKLLVLGACIKTSIFVHAFSPMKTGLVIGLSYCFVILLPGYVLLIDVCHRCNIQRHSESLLRKFIDSLSFSAKMWY